MNLEQLNTMFSFYNDSTLVDFQRIEAGFANDVYQVTTAEDRKFVIKVLKMQSVVGVQDEVTIQAALKGSAIQTPTYLLLRNDTHVGEVDGKEFVISEFIEGKTPETVHEELAINFGETLAQLHNLLDPHKVTIAPNPWQWFTPEITKAEIDKCAEPMKSQLTRMMQGCRELFESDLPKAIVHADFRTLNVFARGNTITTVFDFETTQHTIRILDIGMTYLSLATRSSISPENLIAFICQGYDSKAEQSLTNQEKGAMNMAIKYAAIVNAAWCYNNEEPEFADKLLQLVGESKAA